MIPDRNPKPTLDAVNDAIGALSDLLHSLRAHAKSAAKDVKSTAKDVSRDGEKAGRGAVAAGKRTVRKAKAGGENLLDKAAKVWHDITGSDDDAPRAAKPAATRKRRAKSRTKG